MTPLREVVASYESCLWQLHDDLLSHSELRLSKLVADLIHELDQSTNLMVMELQSYADTPFLDPSDQY